jgi:hypothetical protein
MFSAPDGWLVADGLRRVVPGFIYIAMSYQPLYLAFLGYIHMPQAIGHTEFMSRLRL